MGSSPSKRTQVEVVRTRIVPPELNLISSSSDEDDDVSNLSSSSSLSSSSDSDEPNLALHNEILALAKTLEAEGDYKNARDIYEQLLLEDNVEALTSLAYLDGNMLGVRNLTVEQHRAYNARIAVVCERVFGLIEAGKGGPAPLSSRVSDIKSSFHIPSRPQCNDEDNENESELIAPAEAPNRDSPISLEGLSSVKTSLRPQPFDLDTPNLHPDMDRLQAREKVDGNSTVTLAQRRLLFAEIAVILEQIARRGTSDVANEARYRLARMYVFRLGVDGSDEVHAAQADYQAMEYLEDLIKKQYPAAMYLAALLKLAGRASPYSTPAERQATHAEALALLDSASSSIKAAAAAMAAILEEGRGLDCNTLDSRKNSLLDAAKYYKMTCPANDSIVDEPHPCEKRARLLETMITLSAETCQPGFFLALQLFRRIIAEKLRVELVSRVVCRFLTALSERKSYPAFPTDPAENQSTKIAQFLLDPFKEPAPVNFMEAQEAGEKGNLGKNPQAATSQRSTLLTLQIHQHLKMIHQEWQRDDARQLVQATKSLCKAAMELNAPFGCEGPITALESRIINAATQFNNSIKDEFPSASISLESFLTEIQTTNLRHEWDTLLTRANTVFLEMEPCLRSLEEQEAVYYACLDAMPKLGDKLSPDDTFRKSIQVATLARLLRKEAMQPEESMMRHIYSAITLLDHAAAHNLSIAEARRQLEEAAKPFLQTLPANLTGLCVLGYDVLRDIPSLAAATSAARTEGRQASEQWRKKHTDALLGEGGINSSWLENEEIGNLLCKESQPALTRLFSIACQHVDSLAAQLLPDVPRLDIAAVCYNDPWQPFMTWDPKSALQEEYANCEALGGGDDILEGILDDELIQISGKLINALPHAASDIARIFGRLASGYRNITQNIGAKQKMLIMLKSLMDQYKEDTILVAEYIHNGMTGRCPDGQASFVETWIFESQLVRALNSDSSAPAVAGSELINRTMQLHVALLLADIRNCFIQKHCSPFITGDLSSSTAEARTAMHVLLTQVLRLPLSLPGCFTPVLYAHFSKRAVKNPQKLFSITNLMDRFLLGGTVKFVDVLDGQNYECVVPFDALNLVSLGSELRRSILDTDLTENRSRAPSSFEARNGLWPLPTPSFVIPEKVVLQFIRFDPVVGPFWAIFEASFYTQSNIFFDSAGVNKPGGKVTRNIMRDAAVLRILEVAGYAIVPENFYNSVSANWTFEQM